MEELLRKFKIATNVLDTHKIDYLVFGGIAVWAYGRRRDTHDIDILVRQSDAKHTLSVLSQAGFSTEETDHRWIYKATLDHAFIDIIFEPKGGIRLTPEVLDRRRHSRINELDFTIMDPENLVLLKILATKEIRPADWYDGLSIIENMSESFDWNYLIDKAEKYLTKVLSFVFFIESAAQETGRDHLVPEQVIDRLIDAYRLGQSSSKSS